MTAIDLPADIVWLDAGLGVAVVQGDVMVRTGRPLWPGSNLPDADVVAPRQWAQYDKPCETCEGSGCNIDFCRECGDEYSDACERHADHEPNTMDDGCCPDCRDGRQVWTVRWPCQHPKPRKIMNVYNGRHVMDVCDDCRAHKYPFGQWDVNYLSARATIQVVPVVADLEDVGGAYEGPACLEVNPATGHCRLWPAWSGALEYDDGTDLPLDPLPTPGQFAVIVKVQP